MKQFVIPPQSFNDDDWYIYNPVTLELIERHGRSKAPQPSVKCGQLAARGLRVKYLKLWENK